MTQPKVTAFDVFAAALGGAITLTLLLGAGPPPRIRDEQAIELLLRQSWSSADRRDGDIVIYADVSKGDFMVLRPLLEPNERMQ